MKLNVLLYILLALVLVGCTRYIDVPYIVNNTVYKETLVYNHTVEYINVTTPCEYNNITNSSTKYILGLIQQIKRCESNIIRHWNLTECVWEIEKMNRSLTSCNESLDEIRELLD